MAKRYNLRPRPVGKAKVDIIMNHAPVTGEPHVHERVVAHDYERLVAQICPKYLTQDEANEIREEFNRVWIEDKQLLWSGADYHATKTWAAYHGFQTLTSVMGPLMEKGNDRCKRKTCSQSWSSYMRGASAVFAWRVSQGHVTTVLTPPPPHRFHPSGLTNYQDVEEPILKGVLGSSVAKIMMVHPEVAGAESFVYEAWPSDQSAVWVASFGGFPDRVWRVVGSTRARTIWQPIPGVSQSQPMLENNYPGTINRHKEQLKDKQLELYKVTNLEGRTTEPKHSPVDERQRAINPSPGLVVLVLMVFVEIFLHFALPFIVLLENLTSQFRYECLHSEPKFDVASGSGTPSGSNNPQQSGLVNTDKSASQCLGAKKDSIILGEDIPLQRLTKRQRRKLSQIREKASQPIVTQKPTEIVCRSLGGWDPKSLKKAFKNRARRVTLL